MSGLLALLDDVAAIAKAAAASVDDIAAGAARAAAASVDDVAAGAAKAGVKAAGVVIDDAAVTPAYLGGLPAARELPIVARIAAGSLRNKLVVLLPAALLLSLVAPSAIAPILMAGGLYLCFEGAEKLLHHLSPDGAGAGEAPALSAAHLEETRVRGAIKTDFVLSAEIMTIALASLPPDQGLGLRAVVLAVVAVALTALVYGGVAALVKVDDVGLHLARRARTAALRLFGRGLVRGMPALLALLSAVGTAAMLWVGGGILVHGADELGWATPARLVHDAARALAGVLPGSFAGVVEWAAGAALAAALGVVAGMVVAAALALAEGLRARPG